jgi:hypothetical protein
LIFLFILGWLARLRAAALSVPNPGWPTGVSEPV